MTKKAYRCRIYPNKTQQQLLAQTFGCVRFVFNQLLDATKIMHIAKIQGQWKHPSKVDLVKAVKNLKEDDDFAFLKQVDSIALQASAEDLADGFDRWFKKQNQFPHFKKRQAKNSYTTKATNNNIRFVSKNRLKVPKIGSIKIKDSFGLQDKEIRRITISKEPNGHTYVSILVDEDIPSLPKTNEVIGVDVGLHAFVALSNDTFIQAPKALLQYEEKLAKAQKILSRRIEIAKKEKRSIRDSTNIQKARLKVANIHVKIKHIRTDFCHKISKQLVTSFDNIALEDLKVSNLLQNANLAKHIADASWSRFKAFVQYKADWYGKTVQFVKAAYTSQMCNECKHIDKDSRKGLVFCCTACGHREHADTNAAKNIKEKAFL